MDRFPWFCDIKEWAELKEVELQHISYCDTGNGPYQPMKIFGKDYHFLWNIFMQKKLNFEKVPD